MISYTKTRCAACGRLILLRRLPEALLKQQAQTCATCMNWLLGVFTEDRDVIRSIVRETRPGSSWRRSVERRRR